MSRSIDLFIDAPPGLDDLADQLAQITGLTFAATQGRDGRVLHSGGVTAELTEHDFVDDRDLLFSRYRYVLTAAVTSGRSINDSGEAVLLRQVFSAVKADHRFAALLVFDLQHLMARSAPASGDEAQ